MIFKSHFIILMCLFGFCGAFSQQADSMGNANPEIDSVIVREEVTETNPEQRKLLIAGKYNLSLEKGISSKMLSDGVMHEEPDLTSSSMDFTIKQNEKVYAYKYFPHERSWLINYKSDWGFVADYIIMAVKEETITSYKGQWDVPPKIKTSINPKYPKEAKKAKLEGSVEVKIFIDEKGMVAQTIILNGIDGLNDAAIEAINKAKFEPAQKNGKKKGVWVPTRIKFKL